MKHPSEQLTEKHHAVLFALISRQVILYAGFETGQHIVRKVVRHYGEQRGRRMAMRAKREGKTLTMDNFLKFGEWQSATQEGLAETVAINTNVVSHVLRCPWNNAWLEADLLPYGRLYCLEIDQALVRGFNPNLVISVNQTLSNDGNPCEFVYHQAVLGREESAADKERLMSWEYHCKHLCHSFDDVLGAEFGEEAIEVINMGLSGFETRYGSEKTKLLENYLQTDFTQISRAGGDS